MHTGIPIVYLSFHNLPLCMKLLILSPVRVRVQVHHVEDALSNSRGLISIFRTTVHCPLMKNEGGQEWGGYMLGIRERINECPIHNMLTERLVSNHSAHANFISFERCKYRIIYQIAGIGVRALCKVMKQVSVTWSFLYKETSIKFEK